MNDNELTVVMYHYVRDLKNSRYPEIKGLDINVFDRQLDYLQENYNIISIDELYDYVNNDSILPNNACLLTFDDAYIDHYTYVFPRLVNRGLKGAFYAPVRAVEEHLVLDVNKIHFILASADIQTIISDVKGDWHLYQDNYALYSFEYYYKKLALPDRFDAVDVIFIKRLLQVELPLELRKIIVDKLFSKYVIENEAAFSRELYMNTEQMKTMVNCGMHIGCHGFDHFWLSSLSKEAQEVEIEKSLVFLESIGAKDKYWSICYPYGDYNNDTLDVLNKYNCAFAFTTKVKIANLQSDDCLELPRIDTNDITVKL